MLVHKDEHLFYGAQMMNVEIRKRMDMDRFSPPSRGEQLVACPSPALLQLQGISTDISGNKKTFLAKKWLLRAPLEMILRVLSNAYAGTAGCKCQLD